MGTYSKCINIQYIINPLRANSWSLLFMFQCDVQMFLSAEMTAERWASLPIGTPSPTEVVHKLWVSTGWKTLPAWSADASSWTEPYSSCACQPEQQKRESQGSGTILKYWLESPRFLTNVCKLSNNLLMIHVKTYSYSMALMPGHDFEQITKLAEFWNS